MTINFLKVFLVFSIGVFFLLTSYGNFVDFQTNFIYIKHIISMDTTFQRPQLISRAITDTNKQLIIYQLIIAFQGITAFCCLLSSLLLARSVFHKASLKRTKLIATVSLFLGFCYFFLGFIIMGGEWFCMWQSHVANSQVMASLFSILILMIILFLNQEET